MKSSLNIDNLKIKLIDLIQVYPFLQKNLDDLKIEKLMNFLELLLKWNKTYNLTKITNVEDILVKHFLDSLLFAEYIQDENNFADIGTGAGFPGVPLSILFPEKNFTLVDTLGKRIIFLNYIKATLKLTNINPVKSRVEEVEGNFDSIICRAFAPIDKIFELTNHLVTDGSFFFMKAKLVNETLDYKNYTLIREIDLTENFDNYLNNKLGNRLLLEYKKCNKVD